MKYLEILSCNPTKYSVQCMLVLYHFDETLIIKILQNVIWCNNGLIVCDVSGREDFMNYLWMTFQPMLFGPILSIKLIQFMLIHHENDYIQLFKDMVSYIVLLLFTPVIDISGMHDSMISNARSYHKDELLKMCQIAKNECIQNAISTNVDNKQLHEIKNYQFECVSIMNYNPAWLAHKGLLLVGTPFKMPDNDMLLTYCMCIIAGDQT
eukprot:805060_1